jgi:hypothetical protein
LVMSPPQWIGMDKDEGRMLYTALNPSEEQLDMCPSIETLLGDMMLAACAQISAEHPGAELLGYTRYDNPRRGTTVVYLRHRIPPQEKS